MESYPGSRSAVRQLAAARLISVAGGTAAGIALAYFVYQKTHSGLYLSATFLLTLGVTGFLSPVGGLIADRYDRKLVMVVSECAGAGVFLVMVFVRQPVGLIALAFIGSALRVGFHPASGAAIPNLIGKDDLVWANSLVSITATTGTLIGPAIGGLLVAVSGAPLVFGLNAASFLISAVVIARIRGDFAEERSELDEHGGVLGGLRYVRRDQILLVLAVGWTALGWLAINVGFVADPPLAALFHVGSLGYGLIDTFFAAGALLGGLLARRIVPRSGSRTLLYGAVGMATGGALVALSPVFLLVLAGVFVMATFMEAGDVATSGLVQVRTPDAVRSRVFAALNGIGLVSSAAGYVVAGLLVDAVGPRAVYWLGAGVSLLMVGVCRPVWRERTTQAADGT